jgi:AcrR family transcriptional regulator
MSNKRELIFEAVIDIVKKEGLHSGITVSNIADKAGIGKGTIYEYFNTKDEVIGESLRYFIKDKMENVIDINSYETLSFKKAFKKYIDDVISFLVQDEFIYQLFNNNQLDFTFDKKLRDKVIKDLKKAKEKYEQTIDYFINKAVKEKIINPNINQFNKETIKNIVITSIAEYAQSSLNLEEKEEFINNLYNLVLKILL